MHQRIHQNRDMAIVRKIPVQNLGRRPAKPDGGIKAYRQGTEISGGLQPITHLLKMLLIITMHLYATFSISRPKSPVIRRDPPPHLYIETASVPPHASYRHDMRGTVQEHRQDVCMETFRKEKGSLVETQYIPFPRAHTLGKQQDRPAPVYERLAISQPVLPFRV